MEQFGVQIGLGVTHQSFERDEVIESLLYEMRIQEISEYGSGTVINPMLVQRAWDEDELGSWALSDVSDEELRDAALEFSGRVD